MKSVLLAGVLVFTVWLAPGCTISQAKPYDLSTMPQYVQKDADEHYQAIGSNLQAYVQLLQLAGQFEGSLSDSQKKEYSLILDRYLYWNAVANVHLFNSQWDLSDKASGKAQDALMEFYTKIVQGNSF